MLCDLSRLAIEIVYNSPNRPIRVFPHNFEIIEDGSVRLHRLANAVLQGFQGDAQLKSMLDE